MKTHTESEENYIKALYHLGGDNPVSNGDLAQRVGAKGSSVTQAVKRLSQKNLVTVVPYKGVQLTEDRGFIGQIHPAQTPFMGNLLGGYPWFWLGPSSPARRTTRACAE